MNNLTLSNWSLLALPVLLLCYILNFTVPKKYYVLPKCAGSLICLCTAAIPLFSSQQDLSYISIALALSFFLAGDFLIVYHPLAGGAAFAAGQAVLLFWLLNQVSFFPAVFLLWALDLLAVFLLFQPELSFAKELLFPLSLYAALLTINVSGAAVLAFTKGSPYWPLFLGFLSFQASDLLLGKNTLGTPTHRRRKILMALYYLALYSMASFVWTAS